MCPQKKLRRKSIWSQKDSSSEPTDSLFMKILFITSQFPSPPDSGWNIRVFNLIRGLSARHQVTLLSFFTERDTPARFSEMSRHCSEVFTIRRSSSYSPLDLARGLFTPTPFSIWNYRSREMEKKAKELLSSEDYQVIQVEDIHMSQYLSKSHPGLKILDMHNVESQYLERFSRIERNFLKGWYAELTAGKLKKYEISNSRKFDVCLVVSKSDQKTFQQFARVKSLEIIPNGVDPSFFSEGGVQTDPYTILFMGKLDYRPNLDALEYFLRSIWPLIQQKIPETKFLIVGKGMPEKLKSLLKSRKVILEGYVEDVRKKLSLSTVVVVPLRYGGGTRIKILEALAMEKPVVSTSLGCEGIEVQNGKELLIADSPESFADSVVQVLNHPELAEKLGKSGRKLIHEKYTWQKITQSLEKIYLRKMNG